MKQKNRRAINQTQIDIMPRKEDRRRREENSMKGTGTWLSAPPTIASGHYLTKAEFENAIRIRIGLEPRGMAERCACGSKNNTSHARSCHLGGYVNRRHDAIRDYIYQRGASVYKDLETEPKLKPVGEQTLNPGANVAMEARTDIRINGFERTYMDTHMDVKIINAQADSHVNLHPSEALRKAESGKDKLYKDRLQKVESASFVPMIFTCKGARTAKTTKALSKMITMIAAKRREDKQVVANRVYTDISFLFLKAELACVRGRRKTRTQQT